MNNASRWLSRAFLLVVGLGLALIGVVAVGTRTTSGLRQQWGEVVRPLTGLPAPWVYSLCGGALVLVVAAALLVVGAQRSPRHRQVLKQETPGAEGNRVAVDIDLVDQLLQEKAAHHPEITAATTRTFRSNGTPMLRITLRLKRGADPIAVAGRVHEDLDQIDETVGEHIPRVVEILRERTSLRTPRRALR